MPLHPKNMQQMIHPHFGYLCNFNKLFTFDDLIKAYENQIASSYERSLGQDMLGDELACFSYWLIQDAQRKGFFTLKEVIPLLEVRNFHHKYTLYINRHSDSILTKGSSHWPLLRKSSSSFFYKTMEKSAWTHQRRMLSFVST